MCNINQYKKLKFTDLLEIYNRIVIPAIQRDYAHGREDKKAAEVRKTLLDDIFSNKDEIDFNLVFGSREEYGGKTCFIPVDGQQRLTTLFLLYLYNSKVNGVQIADLNKFTYETRRAAADFCKAIVDNDWENQKDKLSDSIKDCNWFMQYWNQDPTVISMLRMLDDIQKRATEGDFSKKLDRITFYFYDLKQKGLNESLYIKMNGRGKPLTAFENLKAAIDTILPEEMGDEASGNKFKKEWQSCIDGKWTDAFWDKEKPYDIDENLTKFIVRFLSGCYTALKPNSDQTADDETKKQLREINVNDEKSYSSFIPFGPIKKVLELENSFGFLARAFNIISCKKNVHVLYPTCRNSDSPFTISEKTEYKTLSGLMAYVLFGIDEKALRFARNMAENTVFGYDDFIRLCRRFGQIKNHPKIMEGIYTVLSEIEFDNPSEQLKEEIEKARQILTGNYNGNIADLKGKTWEDVIIEAENFAFFKGAIRFLFRNENGEWDWTDFDTKWGNAQRYFDKENGLYKIDSNLLRFFISQFNIENEDTNWSLFWEMVYDNEDSSWRNLLINKKWQTPMHELLNSKKIVSDYKAYQSPFKKNLVWKNVHEDLVRTDLLKHIEKGCLLHWRHENYLLAPDSAKADRKKYVIANKRNEILFQLYGGGFSEQSEEADKIYTDQKIKDCNFFWGLDIRFRFKYNNEEYTFQWQRWNWIDLYDGETRLYYNKEEVKTTFDGSKVKNSDDFIVKLQGCIHSWQQYSSPDNPNKS